MRFIFFKSLCDSQFKEILLGTHYIISVSHSDTAFKIKVVNLFLCIVNSSFTGIERGFFILIIVLEEKRRREWKRRGNGGRRHNYMWVQINVSILRLRKGYIGAASQIAFFKITMKKISYLE